MACIGRKAMLSGRSVAVALQNCQPDFILHARLLKVLAERISDGAVLALIKQWLKAAVVEE
jgi:hypothetical protein